MIKFTKSQLTHNHHTVCVNAFAYCYCLVNVIGLACLLPPGLVLEYNSLQTDREGWSGGRAGHQASIFKVRLGLGETEWRDRDTER